MLHLVVKLFYDKAGHFSHKLIGAAVQIVHLGAVARYDKRSSRLVDKYGVHLVHDGEIVPSLNHVLLVGDHVVSQIVKSELVVGTVCYIAGIRRSFFFLCLVMDNKTGGEAEKIVYSAHLLLTHSRQVFVYGDDMHALALKRVEV